MTDGGASGPLLHKITLTLPAGLSEQEAGGLSLRLEEDACSAALIRQKTPQGAEHWVLTWLVERPPEKSWLAERLGADLAGAARFEPVPETNWLAHSYKQFQPFSVGPFFIYGSHHEGAPPPGLTGLQIDAATAFGSGEHGTTAGCLEALVHLRDEGAAPEKILDMGTGSGILAIAAWKLWRCPVLAVDIDPESVLVAQRHRAMNDIPAEAGGMICLEADGFAEEKVQRAGPWDLVIANILAAPLKDMAADLCAALASRGYAVLSGMLREQADDVLAAYAARGAVLARRIDRGEWATLVLRKTG